MEPTVREETQVARWYVFIVLLLIIAFAIVLFFETNTSMAKSPQTQDDVCAKPLIDIYRVQTPSGNLWSPICLDPSTQTVYINGNLSIGPSQTGTYTVKKW